MPSLGDGGLLDALECGRRRLSTSQVSNELDHRHLEHVGQMFVEPPGGLGDARVGQIGSGDQRSPDADHRRLGHIRQHLGPGLDGFVGLQHPHAQGRPGDRLTDAAREQLELVDRVGRVGLADGADDGIRLARYVLELEFGGAESDVRLDVGADSLLRVGVGVETEALRQEDPGFPRPSGAGGGMVEVDLEVGAVVAPPTLRELGEIRQRRSPRRSVEQRGQARRPVLDPVQALLELDRIAAQHGFRGACGATDERGDLQPSRPTVLFRCLIGHRMHSRSRPYRTGSTTRCRVPRGT